MRFDWTPEILARAKRLYVEGRTAQQVADAIGAPSRNAVIGKLGRAGVTRGRAVGSLTAGAQNRLDSRTREKAAKPKPARVAPPAPAPRPLPELAVEPRIPAHVQVQASTDPGRTCQLLHLTFASCRWPISPPDVEPADTLFCGAGPEEGSVYCPTHRAASGARRRTDAERAADAQRAQLARSRASAAAASGEARFGRRVG